MPTHTTTPDMYNPIDFDLTLRACVLCEKRGYAVLQRRVQEGADRHGPRQAQEEEAELPHSAAGCGGAPGTSPTAASATTLTGEDANLFLDMIIRATIVSRPPAH
jgi:hypothetical protein